MWLESNAKRYTHGSQTDQALLRFGGIQPCFGIGVIRIDVILSGMTRKSKDAPGLSDFLDGGISFLVGECPIRIRIH